MMAAGKCEMGSVLQKVKWAIVVLHHIAGTVLTQSRSFTHKYLCVDDAERAGNHILCFERKLCVGSSDMFIRKVGSLRCCAVKTQFSYTACKHELYLVKWLRNKHLFETWKHRCHRGEKFRFSYLLNCKFLTIVWCNKSRRMRWVGHVLRMGEEWNLNRV
jgi:hypothetical protein